MRAETFDRCAITEEADAELVGIAAFNCDGTPTAYCITLAVDDAPRGETTGAWIGADHDHVRQGIVRLVPVRECDDERDC